MTKSFGHCVYFTHLFYKHHGNYMYKYIMLSFIFIDTCSVVFVIMHLQDICTYYTSFHSQPVLSFPCEIEIKNDRQNPCFVNVQKQNGLHFIFYTYKRVIMAISFKRISRDYSIFISFSLVTEAVICIGIIHH